MFLDAVHDICLFQHITKPTCYRANTTANTLDLVFTNEEGMVDGIKYSPAIGSSDHVCLQFNLLCYSSYNQVSRPKYNLYQANFDTIRQLLQEIDWDDNLYSIDFQHCSQVRNKLHKLTRTLCTNYENKLVSNVKSNPRQFWSYVHSQLKVHPKMDSSSEAFW